MLHRESPSTKAPSQPFSDDDSRTAIFTREPRCVRGIVAPVGARRNDQKRSCRLRLCIVSRLPVRKAKWLTAMTGTRPWWESAVIYQVYPRSFQDSDGNGVGDLNGISERLPYFVELGVDAIWISPIFRSPMTDFGYDISDYIDIDP